jgi:DNA-binding NarL/FixJ family response regulator
MRVLLVGSAAWRAQARARLADAGVEVVGEFTTISNARASAAVSDGILIAPAASSDEPTAALDAEPLTAREVQVLELLAEGLPNKAIAVRLRISDQTVKFHVASISGKLGAANRTAVVRRAARRGLITI